MARQGREGEKGTPSMIELVRFTRDDHHAGHRVYVNPAQVTHVYRNSRGEGTVICVAAFHESGQTQLQVAEGLRDVVALLTGRVSEP